MTDVVSANVRAAGVPRRHIHAERFALPERKETHAQRLTVLGGHRRALASPARNAAAAAAARSAAREEEGRHDEDVHRRRGQADRWGNVEVTIVVKKTTTTVGTKKVTARATSTSACPSTRTTPTARMFINQQALPSCSQERSRRRARTSHMVSGATDTSEAFEQSLQSALPKAKACSDRRGPAGRPPRRARHGHADRRRRARRRATAGRSTPCSTGSAGSTRRFSTYKRRQRDQPLDRGELALADAHPEVREVLDRCEELRRETDGLLRRRARPATARPVGPRQGLVGRPRRRDPRRAGAPELRDQRRRRHASARARRSPSRVARRHPAPARARQGRGRRRVRRPRGRDLGRVRPRRPRPRPAHAARRRPGVLSVTITGPELATADAYATAAFAMGDGGPGLDCAAARLRGADDPRRRARALDPGFPAPAEQARPDCPGELPMRSWQRQGSSSGCRTTAPTDGGAGEVAALESRRAAPARAEGLRLGLGRQLRAAARPQADRPVARRRRDEAEPLDPERRR